jgi:MGT family glycosyltransferase
VEGQGFDCFRFEHVNETVLYQTMFPEDSPAASLKHPFRFFRVLQHWLLETIPSQILDVTKVLSHWTPDVLITDVTLWSPFLILADKMKTPVTVLSFAPGCMVPHPRLPPWGLGIEPPRVPWKRIPYHALVRLHRLAAEIFRRQANRLRREHALPPISVPVNTYAARMPLYLVPSARELDDVRHDLPSSVHYVGPLSEPASDGFSKLPDWFSSLRDGRPRIHVTEGTVSFQRPFLLQAALEAFAGQDCELILTTDREKDLDFLDPSRLPRNVHVERFIPHDTLMPKVDCLVTTGGAGTVLSGLRYGVPMVIAPTEWDKPDNARHVRNAGAGLVISPARCRGSILARTVQKVLDDPSFRENALKMGAILKSYQGARAAAKLLEELCRSHLHQAGSPEQGGKHVAQD